MFNMSSRQHFHHLSLKCPLMFYANETLLWWVQSQDDRWGHSDITVKVAPAGDVTRGPMGEDLSSLWKTSHADAVIHYGALIQFQQGEIVSVGKSLSESDSTWRMRRADFMSLLRSFIQTVFTVYCDFLKYSFSTDYQTFWHLLYIVGSLVRDNQKVLFMLIEDSTDTKTWKFCSQILSQNELTHQPQSQCPTWGGRWCAEHLWSALCPPAGSCRALPRPHGTHLLACKTFTSYFPL